MENDSVKPEEEYQASEQEHEIYQPEREPEQKTSGSPKKPLMLIIGLILLIILFYKIYLYFFASPQNQVPGSSTISGTEVTLPVNKTTQSATTASATSIPSITPASSVSPAANVPNTQPAAAVAVTPPPAPSAPTPAATTNPAGSAPVPSVNATPAVPSIPAAVQEPAIQATIAQPVAAKPATVTPAKQLTVQSNMQKPATPASVSMPTVQPTVKPAAISATQPGIQTVTQKTTMQTTTNQSAVATSQPQAGTTPISSATQNSAAVNAADTMQNNRLDTLEQGMNENRTSIQNLQNQINSLASSVSNLQTGINNINNTLGNIKNMQIQTKPQQIPVKSTIIKHKRINVNKHIPALQETAYLAQPKVARIIKRIQPPSQGMGQTVGGGRQYYVKAMIQGRAWLVSGDGATTVTVSSGDYLPGYGLVEDINPQQGIVTTSAGGIIQFNPADR